MTTTPTYSRYEAQAPLDPNIVDLWDPETSGQTLDRAWATAKAQATFDPRQDFGVLGLAHGIATHSSALPATLTKIARFYGNPCPPVSVPTMQAVARHPNATVETLKFLIRNYNKEIAVTVLLSDGWQKLERVLGPDTQP
jgi:hypothetical protein